VKSGRQAKTPVKSYASGAGHRSLTTDNRFLGAWRLGAVGSATALAFAGILALAAVVAALAAALAFAVVLAFTGMLGGALVEAGVAETGPGSLYGVGAVRVLSVGGNGGASREASQRRSEKQSIQLILHIDLASVWFGRRVSAIEWKQAAQTLILQSLAYELLE
jgi:hypothetical protein